MVEGGGGGYAEREKEGKETTRTDGAIKGVEVTRRFDKLHLNR